jgi:predicted transcriptional regulator
MTKLFKEAVEAISVLPEEMQDELARALLQLAGIDQPLVDLTPEEEAAIDASIAQAERGEFATDEEIRAIWAKHGL